MGAGIQMAFIITGGILLGKYLDKGTENNHYTIAFTLGSLFLAIGYFLKKAIDITQENE